MTEGEECGLFARGGDGTYVSRGDKGVSKHNDKSRLFGGGSFAKPLPLPRRDIPFSGAVGRE